MALFTDDDLSPSKRRGIRGATVGAWLLVVVVVGIFALTLIPTPYVYQQPGPVFDTLGNVSYDGESVALIDIPDERTYPTDGSLSLLTVGTVGSRTNPLSWWEIVVAWLDPSKAVIPIDRVYPVGFSVDDANEANRILMENSQQEAVAAALFELGYEFGFALTIDSLIDDSPSAGILEPGDQVLSANGVDVAGVNELRDAIADHGSGSPMRLVILRDGEERTVEVTPEDRELEDADGTLTKRAAIGVYLRVDYDLPVEVNIQLENVGGPSGGQMFALGIIDKLTPGSLTGGADVAGTGTITGSGDVGAIGGIRQKMYGALNSGAEWFLAPIENCDEVVGHVPDGLTVVAVDTLRDALDALEAIKNGADAAALPACTAR
ncbi:MAG: PDZ domain-containing protein [Cryobacterium sp.]|nr:PDZ domain-containing protein [Cryobacterium sp.]